MQFLLQKVRFAQLGNVAVMFQPVIEKFCKTPWDMRDGFEKVLHVAFWEHKMQFTSTTLQSVQAARNKQMALQKGKVKIYVEQG